MGILALDKDKYDLATLTDQDIDDSAEFLTALLVHVANGGTINSFYKNNSKSSFGKGYVCKTKLRLTLSVGDESQAGVAALMNHYARARCCWIESQFDELIDIFNDDRVYEDPRLASAMKGKSSNLMWCLSKLKPQTYGDKIQVEQTVDINIIDRLHAGRERVASIKALE
jgi:hypothetical protein